MITIKQSIWRWLPLLAGVTVLLAYIWTSAPTITTEYGSSDSGELAAAVATGGVAHPPGYPTYLLVGRVALLLPWGEPAARLVWLNSACVALAALVLAAALPRRSGAGWHYTLAAISTIWLFGFDRRIWQQAIVVEVYGLALLLLTLLWWLTGRWWQHHLLATVAALGLVFGLGLGVQLPIGAWLVGVLLVWLVERPAITWRTTTLFGIMLLLGASVYAVLVWRGRVAAATSWGDWRTLSGIWAHVSASEYRYLVGIVPASQMLARIGFALSDSVDGLGWLGSGLAVFGLYAAPDARRWRWLSLGVAGSALLWAISYGGADALVYLLPLHLLAAWWAGCGILALLQQIEQIRWQRIIALIVLIGAFGAVRYAPALSLRHATQTRDFAIAQLQAAPANAIIRTNDDATTFGLWYAQQVLGVRADVRIEDQRLTRYQWYQQR